jgi:hypothetical protein
MKHRRTRPPIRLMGVGAGVLLVALATSARGPAGGSLEAFAKPSPSRVPLTSPALPDVSSPDSTLGVERGPSLVEDPAGVASLNVTWADIPAASLDAYRTAAYVLQQSAPRCDLTWEVLAGIGRVESDHGRYGGATVSEDGISYPPIYGVALDGTGDVAEIHDTDNGAMDGDPVWDRAVGPMQFLPSTWDIVGVDADDDGVANPHDIDDAALAAGVYLCAGGVDLSDPEQLREALLRYNPSAEYAALVQAYIEAYRRGEPVVEPLPDLTPPSGPPTNLPSPTHPPTQPGHPSLDGAFGGNHGPDPNGPPGEPFANLPLPTEPHNQHGHHPNSNGPSDGNGPQQPTPTDPSPTDPTPTDPSPTDPSPTDPTPTDPTPTDPTPTDPSPTDPTPTDPTPTDPSPTDPTPPSPQPPELTTLTGELQPCDAGWCIETTLLYLGPDDYVQDTRAPADYDNDGTIKTIAEELAELAGDEVSLEVEVTESSAAVYTIQGLPYRPTDGSPAPWESD